MNIKLPIFFNIKMDLTQLPTDSFFEICQHLDRDDLRKFIDSALKNRDLAIAIKPCIDIYKGTFVKPTSKFRTINVNISSITQRSPNPIQFWSGINGSWYLIQEPTSFEPMIVYHLLPNGTINPYTFDIFRGKPYIAIQSVNGVLYIMDDNTTGDLYRWTPNHLTTLKIFKVSKNNQFVFSMEYKDKIVYKFVLNKGSNYIITFYIYDTKTNTVRKISYTSPTNESERFSLTEDYILDGNVRIDMKSKNVTPFNTPWLVMINQDYVSGLPYKNMLYYQNKVLDVANDTETPNPNIIVIDLYENILLSQNQYHDQNPTNFTLTDISSNTHHQFNIPGPANLHSQLYNILIVNGQTIQLLLPY